MKCGVAEGWQYPSTRGNLLTAGARWRYSLAQERNAHSDTTASVCATGSLAVIYDASRAITLSLTLIQQFIYCHACIRAEVSFLQRGGGAGKCLQSARVTSIVSQETSHVTLFSRGKQMKHRVFSLCCWPAAKCRRSLWCCRKQLKWRSMTTAPPEPRQAGAAGRRWWGTKQSRYQTGLSPWETPSLGPDTHPFSRLCWSLRWANSSFQHRTVASVPHYFNKMQLTSPSPSWVDCN